jgi:virulence-associated protein VagC
MSDRVGVVAREGSVFVTPVTFSATQCFSNTEEAKESDMSKNHYVTKAKRRNRSGKRKDTRRIAANMTKIKELERSSGRKQ